MARPAGGGAGRPRSGRAGRAGAFGRTAGPRAEAARGVRAAVRGKAHRRGAFPAAAMRGSSRERDREDEGLAGKFTAGSIWAEFGRREVLGVRGCNTLI